MMNLRADAFLWSATSAIALRDVPMEGVDAQVAIIGMGITGAVLADQLQRAGYDVTLIDRRPPATGSTQASTAIIKYELDTPLSSLAHSCGFPQALEIYRASFEAAELLKRIAAELSPQIGFRSGPALQLAHTFDAALRLKVEFLMRVRAGFESSWLNSSEVRDRYSWTAAAALRNSNAATVDPMQMACELLERSVVHGARTYAGSVVRFDDHQDHKALHLTSGAQIRCQKLILASGLESDVLLQRKVGKRIRSYAGATEPGINVPKWDDGAIVWETGHSYHSLRRTPDERIIIGGRIRPFRNALLRDLQMPFDKFQLTRKLRELIGIPNLTLTSFWTSTYAEEDYGLPFIGQVGDDNRLFAVFGGAGNGITFSALGARLAGEWLEHKTSTLAQALSLGR